MITGKPKLNVTPEDSKEKYAEYMYWLNYANATFQCMIMRCVHFTRVEDLVPKGHPTLTFMQAKLHSRLNQLETRLTKVEGEVGENEDAYLTGNESTLPGMMIVVCLATMRPFYPVYLSAWPAVLR